MPSAAPLATSRTPVASKSVPFAPPFFSVAAGAAAAASKSFWIVPLSVMSTDAMGAGPFWLPVDALGAPPLDVALAAGELASGAAARALGPGGTSAGFRPPHAAGVTPAPKSAESIKRLVVVLFMGRDSNVFL